MPGAVRRWKKKISEEPIFQVNVVKKQRRVKKMKKKLDDHKDIKKDADSLKKKLDDQIDVYMSSDSLKKKLDDQVDSYMSGDASIRKEKLDRDVEKYFASS